MDLFGKILVFVNFGLSLLMAAVGGAVLYYRVDWSNSAATADQPVPGELVARMAKVAKAQSLVAPAGVAWSNARAALPPREDARRSELRWYAVELEHLRTDPNNKPILALDYQNANTVPDPNNKDAPLKMVAVADRYGQPLLSRKVYAKLVGEKEEAIATAFEDLIASEEKDTELTLRLKPADIPGLIMNVDAQLKVYEPKPGDDAGTAALKAKLTQLLTEHKKQLLDVKGPTNFARGLDQRIQDEKAKLKGITNPHPMKDEQLGETEVVKLAEGQVRADSQLLSIRKRELEKRVEELEKPAVTTTNP